MGSEFCEEHAEEVGENYMLANQSKLAEEYGIVGYEDTYIGVFLTRNIENMRKHL